MKLYLLKIVIAFALIFIPQRLVCQEYNYYEECDIFDGTLCYNITGDNTVEVTTRRASIPNGWFDLYLNYPELYGSVVIPSTVKSNEGEIYSVTSIGNAAFIECHNMTTVTIPYSVISIGDKAFSYCSSLTSVKVENGNTKYDSRNNCNAIIETETNTLIAGCQNTTIPNSVTSIGSNAFTGCSGLTAVTIPNSVVTIGFRAFYESSLTSVDIPSSVTSIDMQAFGTCSGLSEIRSKIVNVADVWMGTSVFNFVPTSSCVLKVPIGTSESYQNADQWKDFANIVEVEFDAEAGDMDDDGEVNGTDLNILINIILGKDNAANYGGRANVDGSGGIDGSDINMLINILLGKN